VGVRLALGRNAQPWVVNNFGRTGASTNCTAGLQKRPSSAANRNPPKPYGRSARWNGSPRRTNRAEPRCPAHATLSLSHNPATTELTMPGDRGLEFSFFHQQVFALNSRAVGGAVQRPTMKFVAIKPAAQLDLQALHRVRKRLVSQRTGISNQIHAFLLDRGVAVRQGPRFLRAELPILLATRSDVLSPRMMRVIEELAGDWRSLDERIEGLSKEIEALARPSGSRSRSIRTCRRGRSSAGPRTCRSNTSRTRSPMSPRSRRRQDYYQVD
jgi:hypothetical protein